MKRSAQVLRILVLMFVCWLVFIAPPITLLSLLKGSAFYSGWFASLMLIPLPLLLVVGVFRWRNTTVRWWVFQYLGVSGIGVTAAALGALLSLAIPNTSAGLIALLLFVLFVLFSIRAAHKIHMAELQISSAKIVEPITLVQISDVHVGSRRAAHLEKIIELVNAQQPDALLITGDLIDENVPEDALSSLASLDYPIFYSSGNHERYVDYKKAVSNIAAQGVTVLSDAAQDCLGIKILGVEDRQSVAHAEKALASLCDSKGPEPFRVLLYHQPDLWQGAIQQGIDLMLAGHTHKGQIWPFGLFVRMRYKQVAGHFQQLHSHLFVSQGAGTWGPIMRFGTRCEITVIKLRNN